jgi:hypothetical protein
MTYRLGITPLTRKATISKRSKADPRLAIGKVQDVHNDFLQAVLEWLERGDVQQVIHLGDENFVISCEKDQPHE